MQNRNDGFDGLLRRSAPRNDEIQNCNDDENALSREISSFDVIMKKSLSC